MTDTETQPANGLWLVDKPAGPTSADICDAIRRSLGGARVGHAGTLDPFATGLLVIATGRMTRLVQFITDVDKTYLARVRFGVESVTGDPEGPLTPTNLPLPTPDDISAAVLSTIGPQVQRVPAYAAVKVDGERLYEKARRGEVFETPERNITIHSATVDACDPAGGWVDVTVACSKGTYLRQYATDLGAKLGCGAYCESLRRTAVGALSVTGAVPADAVPHRGRISTATALEAFMDVRAIDIREADAVFHGRRLAGDGSGPVALTFLGEVVAIAIGDGEGSLRPKVVLG